MRLSRRITGPQVPRAGVATSSRGTYPAIDVEGARGGLRGKPFRVVEPSGCARLVLEAPQRESGRLQQSGQSQVTEVAVTDVQTMLYGAHTQLAQSQLGGPLHGSAAHR